MRRTSEPLRPHPPPPANVRDTRGVRPQLSGFTLLEVVVVLLIITIILGMVGVNLTRNPADTLRDEADRLALVLQNAQQQAILEGKPYGFTFTEKGYLFLRLDANNRLVPIETDELLTPRELPPAITLTPSETINKNAKPTDPNKRYDLIVFDPSGEFPVFNLALSIGDLYWYVRGQSDGQVLSSPLAEPTKS
jgi:general secretion pathway protein H